MYLPQKRGSLLLRVQLKPDGTRWRTGGEVKGKLANGVGSQYSSLPRNLVYPALLTLMRLWLPVVDWTDAPTDLNGLVRFAERRNLVCARVPSHFKRSLHRSKTIRNLPQNRATHLKTDTCDSETDAFVYVVCACQNLTSAISQLTSREIVFLCLLALETLCRKLCASLLQDSQSTVSVISRIVVLD